MHVEAKIGPQLDGDGVIIAMWAGKEMMSFRLSLEQGRFLKARSIIDEDARPLVVYLPAARAVLTGAEALRYSGALGCRGIDGLNERTALAVVHGTNPRSAWMFCVGYEEQVRHIAKLVRAAIEVDPPQDELISMVQRVQAWRRLKPLRANIKQSRVRTAEQLEMSLRITTHDGKEMVMQQT
jgi:hypothetical protein